MRETRLTHARRIRLAYPKGPDGRPVCRWCKGPITATNRRLWCSQKCVDEYRIRNDPNFIRRQVYNRDHGICACCGVDTDAIKDHWWRLRAACGGQLNPEEWRAAQDAAREYQRFMEGRGLDFGRSWMWEADHIVEVAAGGAELGLENYQTLCPECHHAKTAAFAAARARERRLARQPELEIAVTTGPV